MNKDLLYKVSIVISLKDYIVDIEIEHTMDKLYMMNIQKKQVMDNLLLNDRFYHNSHNMEVGILYI